MAANLKEKMLIFLALCLHVVNAQDKALLPVKEDLTDNHWKSNSNEVCETKDDCTTTSNAQEQNIDFELDLPDKPLQIVAPDPEHKTLVINEQNIKYLHKIYGEVAIIAVVGKYHSGKSFLMNQLMNKSEGFGIGFTVQPQTMGIWIWGKPLRMTLSTGRKVSVIILDTEGFAANNVSENYDAKIFAVSTLLSSYLLYNSVKIIDQADIDYLELLARRTQLFALRSQISKASSIDFNHDLLTFPPLLWIVQDFVQTTNGQTPQQWLHEMMASRVRETDGYSHSILGMFKSVDCHTLFLPASTKKHLSDLSLAKELDLTEEYREERDELIKKIKRELVPKERDNEPLTGPQIASLLDVLVQAANNGSLAQVPSRWHIFMQRLRDTAVEDCFKFYVAEMKVIKMRAIDNPIEPQRLTDWHVASWKKGLKLLNQLLFGLGEVIETASNRLSALITDEHARMKELNDKRIRLYINEVMHNVQFHAESKFSQVKLPMTSSELNTMTTLIWNECAKEMEDTVRNYASSTVLTDLIRELTGFVETTSNSVGLKNSKLYESLLESAIEKITDAFRNTIIHEMNVPLSSDKLEELLASKKKYSYLQFDKATVTAQQEKMFQAYDALFKKRVGDVDNEMRKRNVELVKIEGQILVRDTVNKFKQVTTSDKLPLPLDASELHYRLAQEMSHCMSMFNDIMQEFHDFDILQSIRDDLEKELKLVWDIRRQENLRAFTKEVSAPLRMAKDVVLVSAQNYNTNFALRNYIKKICLLHLNEGKAKDWTPLFRNSIVEHFIDNDEELISLLSSRTGMYSHVVGFFQWLAYLVNLH